MKYIITILFFSSTIHIFSQEVICTSGDYDKKDQGSLSWTLGEIVTGIGTDGNYVLSQGFQQDFLTVNSIEENNPNQSHNFKVYPNPTTTVLNIEYIGNNYKDFDVSLIDLNGKFLKQESVTNKKLAIDMSKYNSSVYILKIEQESKIIATYQVIKK